MLQCLLPPALAPSGSLRCQVWSAATAHASYTPTARARSTAVMYCRLPSSCFARVVPRCGSNQSGAGPGAAVHDCQGGGAARYPPAACELRSRRHVVALVRALGVLGPPSSASTV
jgi:hypothetical protein